MLSSLFGIFYFYSPITTAQKQYCSTMYVPLIIGIYRCLGSSEAADHIIPKKNSGTNMFSKL